MARVRVSGPILEQAIARGEELRTPMDQMLSRTGTTTSEEDGSTYINIHIGWKSFVVFGLVVAQALASLILQNTSL
jgi:hypothetical protein